MDEIQKFTDLKATIAGLSDKKIRLEERFNNEKERLEKLLAEITSKGYDPKKLSEIRKQKEEELKTLLETLNSKVEETQSKLNEIEA
jgi:Skp family chaperone for outer membrane proteins